MGGFDIFGELIDGRQRLDVVHEDHLVERFLDGRFLDSGLFGLSLGSGLSLLLSGLLRRMGALVRVLVRALMGVLVGAFAGLLLLWQTLHFLKGEGLDVEFELRVQVLDVLVERALVEESLGASRHWAEVLVTIFLFDVDLHVLLEVG